MFKPGDVVVVVVKPNRGLDIVIGYYFIADGGRTVIQTTRGVYSYQLGNSYIVNGFFCYRVTPDKVYTLKQYFYGEQPL